jgi:hypothetical protein
VRLSINNKPYEGLKQEGIAVALSSVRLSINNKPYEGLKLNLLKLLFFSKILNALWL